MMSTFRKFLNRVKMGGADDVSQFTSLEVQLVFYQSYSVYVVFDVGRKIFETSLKSYAISFSCWNQRFLVEIPRKDVILLASLVEGYVLPS